ncbi:AlpA family transcriptional regulator [Frankia sp. AgPm24]|uniref:AlpA family transcriptional regulator n=1 Tax=Frankia sp. AgPm24 TaxID=631128 RepID=UPI00200C96CB|nr:AlpA family transcriptional regulator [Frankia sp. AgPm24]MCK9921920.1 AlpA family transcriptional regulator [Frankia sp. AgPm24]
MKKWTEADILRLPAVIDIVTAGEILGIGRTQSYRLAKTGDFPVKTIRVGNRYKVPTALIRRHLHLDEFSIEGA